MALITSRAMYASCQFRVIKRLTGMNPGYSSFLRKARGKRPVVISVLHLVRAVLWCRLWRDALGHPLAKLCW
jgi:hypothetical protein